MTEFWKKHLADTITIAFFAIAGVALAIYAALPKNGAYDSLKAEITLDGKRLEKNGYLDLSSYGEEETEIEIIGAGYQKGAAIRNDIGVIEPKEGIGDAIKGIPFLFLVDGHFLLQQACRSEFIKDIRCRIAAFPIREEGIDIFVALASGF